MIRTSSPIAGRSFPHLGFGGDVTYNFDEGNGIIWRIHKFLTVGNHKFLTPEGYGSFLQVLVVAGGAGGNGGGGGAGGLIHNTNYTLVNDTLDVTVGNGGALQANGGNSVFDTLIAIGGGTGAGGNGGSGGGAWFGAVGLGTVGQGNNGGASIQRGGGGGGAGSDGNQSINLSGGAGGVGLEINITGTPTYYAGGGGGGGDLGQGGAGGNGGGMNGSLNTQFEVAPANLGGGGGGSYLGYSSAGGSGIVVVRYRIQ